MIKNSCQHSYSSFPILTNNLKVYGEGVITVPPDQAIVTLGVQTENPILNIAQDENSKIMNRVIQSLVSIGIPREKIKTVIYRVDMQYDYENGKQKLKGYVVNHQLQVIIDQILLTGNIVDQAVNEGVNFISNIQFTVKNIEPYYNNALSLAIYNGQSKAYTIAKSLGVTINPIPFNINEQSRTPSTSPFEMTLLAKSDSTPIQQGELKIIANVVLEFSYY